MNRAGLVIGFTTTPIGSSILAQVLVVVDVVAVGTGCWYS